MPTARAVGAGTRHAVAELVAWGRGRRRRVRVRGRSMVPTLLDGDQVLIDPIAAPHVGDLVVVHHPDESRSVVLIKRVVAIGAAGSLELRSDDPEAGTDSRSFGPVGADRLIGVVTFGFDRRRRVGRTRRDAPGRRCSRAPGVVRSGESSATEKRAEPGPD